MTKCPFELDQRPDRDLLALYEAAYRFIRAALGDTYGVRIENDGLPDAVEHYLLYTAALMYGAAEAALTLTLHNLGRESRIIERQIFEFSARAHHYANNPNEAKKHLLSAPFREREILDQLMYDKTAERYVRIAQACAETLKAYPNASAYKEPILRSIIGPGEDPRYTAYYAFFYRVPSQMIHATIAGVGGVVKDDDLTFDSRLEDPNRSLVYTTNFVVKFLSLLNEHLRIEISGQLGEFQSRLNTIRARLDI